MSSDRLLQRINEAKEQQIEKLDLALRQQMDKKQRWTYNSMTIKAQTLCSVLD